MSLTIDFKFEKLSDSLAFEKWKEGHKDADFEQVVAHAKANGAIGCKLGDGSEWEF